MVNTLTALASFCLLFLGQGILAQPATYYETFTSTYNGFFNEVNGNNWPASKVTPTENFQDYQNGYDEYWRVTSQPQLQMFFIDTKTGLPQPDWPATAYINYSFDEFAWNKDQNNIKFYLSDSSEPVCWSKQEPDQQNIKNYYTKVPCT